jgi:hypothetical protein
MDVIGIADAAVGRHLHGEEQRGGGDEDGHVALSQQLDPVVIADERRLGLDGIVEPVGTQTVLRGHLVDDVLHRACGMDEHVDVLRDPTICVQQSDGGAAHDPDPHAGSVRADAPCQLPEQRLDIARLE